MDGPEVIAVLVAGVGGWALGRQRQETTTRAASAEPGEPIGVRVERGGREMADHLGAAIGTGGLKASVVAAKGARAAGNALATGAGKSMAALDGARSTVGSAIARARHADDAPARAGGEDDPLTPGDVALATKSEADLIATVDPAPDVGAHEAGAGPPADASPNSPA
jgi:hypothetical protein